MMYNLNTLTIMKNMAIKELKDFIFESYLRQIGFS